MNNGIKIIDPVTDARWDAYIARAGGSVFHHSAWKRVIEKTYRARPLYLAACNGDGDVGCGMPFFLTSGMLTGKALVSLPFSDYCDVLTRDAGEFRALWESALDWGRENGARYIEIRARDRAGIDFAPYALEKSRTYLNHFLEIKNDIEFMEKKVIEKSYKYDIRQAVKNGVTVKAAESEPEMRQYYGLYLMTRKRHGLPPIPLRLLQERMGGPLSGEDGAPLSRVLAGAAHCGHNLPAAQRLPLRALRLVGRRLPRQEAEPSPLVERHPARRGAGPYGFRLRQDVAGQQGPEVFQNEMGGRRDRDKPLQVRDGNGGNGHSRALLEKALPRFLKVLPPGVLKLIGNITYRYM